MVNHWQEVLEEEDKKTLGRLLQIPNRSFSQQRLAEILALKLGYDFDYKDGHDHGEPPMDYDKLETND